MRPGEARYCPDCGKKYKIVTKETVKRLKFVPAKFEIEKEFAVERRNWLFAKSIRGADASAIVYSITETAILNRLQPYTYLTYILDQMRQMGAFPKQEDMKKLLPWSSDIPEECKTKIKK